MGPWKEHRPGCGSVEHWEGWETQQPASYSRAWCKNCQSNCLPQLCKSQKGCWKFTAFVKKKKKKKKKNCLEIWSKEEVGNQKQHGIYVTCQSSSRTLRLYLSLQLLDLLRFSCLCQLCQEIDGNRKKKHKTWELIIKSFFILFLKSSSHWSEWNGIFSYLYK